MIRTDDLLKAFMPLIGWQQHYDPQVVKLEPDLLKSESGLYYQQAHPLLTIDNLLSIAPDFTNVGTVIAGSFNDDYNEDFEGIKRMNSLFSQWLREKTKASILKAINSYCNEKLATKTGRSILEDKVLFTGTGRLVDTIKNTKSLVGLEIVPIRAKGITVKLNRIGLQFTVPGDYYIYIWHSSQSEPVKTFKFTRKTTGSFEWFNLDFDLAYGHGVDAGGSWYIGYNQAELPEGAEAIFKVRDWSTKPCAGCNRIDFALWESWSKHLEVHPFRVNQDTTDMWDPEAEINDYTVNYGINLDLSVHCDITDFIIANKELFQDVVIKQVAIDFLREFAYNANVRTNRRSINASRVDILYEIDGDSSSLKKSGLAYQLELAKKALNISTKGINPVCLPCRNNGVKFRTV